MEKKLVVPQTAYHRAAELLSLVLLLGTSGFLLIGWDAIPERIPLHYNVAGEIDRWGNKAELWLFPAIAVILFLGIALLQRFPQAWNTGITVTEENRDTVYRELKNLIVTVKLVIMSTFSFLTVWQAMARPLPAWFSFVELSLLFGSILFFLIRLYRKGMKKQ